MKYFAIIALLVIVGVAGFVVVDDREAISLKEDGKALTVTVGANVVVYEKTAMVEEEYRVFSFEISDESDSPFSHIDAFMALFPKNRAKNYWKEDNCEARACDESIMTPVIASNDEVRAKIEEMQDLYETCLEDGDKSNDRYCVILKGETLIKKQHTFKGNDLRISGGSLHQSESLLVTGIRCVPW